jgi:FemAB-related protein (PEP-CTERM system-associated)
MTVRMANLADPREVRAIDTFLAEREEAKLFHRPAWSRAVERGCGALSHYLVSEKSSGKLRGVLPLSEIRSPLFGNSMVSAGFGTGGGILADNLATMEALAAAAWTLAVRHGVPSVELRGGMFPAGQWDMQEGVYANFAADFPAGDEEILLSLKRRRYRSQIRRTFGYPIEYRTGTCAENLDRHYHAYSTSVRNLGTPVFPRALFAAMAEEFGSDAQITTALLEGEAVSTVFSLYYKGVVYFYWIGGTPKGRSLDVNLALYYRVMCDASRRGCTRLDFGRSKLGTGAYEFKENWGMLPEPLVYAVRTADGAEPREINPLDPKYRLKIAMWQKLPLPVANRVGPLIARGLG